MATVAVTIRDAADGGAAVALHEAMARAEDPPGDLIRIGSGATATIADVEFVAAGESFYRGFRHGGQFVDRNPVEKTQ